MSRRDIDRIAPTRRPDAAPAGTQRWRELLFLHWSFSIAEVRRLVPEPLAIDAWDGRAWVGLVPFAMKNIRSSWMPKSTGLDFLETNVRTYVHHDGVPGVYFFSLEASSWLAVKAARLVWGLPYFHASMDSSRERERFSYDSKRRGHGGASLGVEWEVGDLLGPSVPGTFEHFLLERYVLFSFSRKMQLRRGQVHHAPYPAQRATVKRLEQTLVASAGLELASARAPEVVHYAEGVDVEVFGPWPADGDGGRGR
jgi:uncharacterized protein